VYCRGKREGDWLGHHAGTLPIDLFQTDEFPATSNDTPAALSAGGGGLTCDRKEEAARQKVTVWVRKLHSVMDKCTMAAWFVMSIWFLKPKKVLSR